MHSCFYPLDQGFLSSGAVGLVTVAIKWASGEHRGEGCLIVMRGQPNTAKSDEMGTNRKGGETY